MISLNELVSVILFVFRGNNPEFIPACIPELLEKPEKKNRKGGRIVINSTKRCCLLNFLDLTELRYELVSAYFRKEDSYIVKFTFVLAGRIEPDEQRLEPEERARRFKGFEQICHNSFWQTRGFLNPLEDNGSGKSMLSINSTANERVYEDGERRKVWPRDKGGNIIDDKKVEFKPKHEFCIDQNGGLLLSPFSE